MSTTLNVQGTTVIVQEPLEPTSILHRTPWTLPLAESAEGIYITLKGGQKLIDAAGGAAVTCLGNGVESVVQAIQNQTSKMAYIYSMQLSSEPAEELAKNLIASSKGAFELVAFVSGGSEAMEAVIKMGRQYFLEVNQPKRTRYIARHLSYHGNTLGTLALASHPTRKAPYHALLPDPSQGIFDYVSPAYYQRFAKPGETEDQYVQRLKDELEQKFLELGPDTIIGFVAETVVGATTGAVPAPKGYFKAMKEICEKYGALFILDEVMSGMGRMGTLHAWESFGDGVAPDLQAVAKGLGGGYVSIGAMFMNHRIASGLRQGSGFMKHGHTYQNHPIACAGALAVQKVIEGENLLENARNMGVLLSAQLREQLSGSNSPAKRYVFDIRGGGLFWGVEFDVPEDAAKKMVAKFGPSAQFAALLNTKCFDNGMIVMAFSGGANLEGTKGDHLLLAPAYNITPEQVAEIVRLTVKSVEELVTDIES